MNIYGFQKVRLDGKMYFFHEFFQKNQKYVCAVLTNRSLITQIVRKPGIKPDEESKEDKKDVDDTVIKNYFFKVSSEMFKA